jgi:hypothetical protein
LEKKKRDLEKARTLVPTQHSSVQLQGRYEAMKVVKLMKKKNLMTHNLGLLHDDVIYDVRIKLPTLTRHTDIGHYINGHSGCGQLRI